MDKLEGVIRNTNHSKEQRDYFANLIIHQPELLPKLFEFCNLVDDDISYRANWGLEFLCRKELCAVLPHMERFTELLPITYKDPGVRPLVKICEYLIMAYYKDKVPAVQKELTLEYRKKITEACFDWLLSNHKVAAKAYAMTSLYLLGTEFDWVHPELKIILENNYASNSAAYKARARVILKKIK